MLCEATLVKALNELPTRDATWRETYVPIVAETVRHLTGSPAKAATLIAIGYFESGFLPRIQAGECYAWECDRGQAHGWFQQHPWVPEWNALLGLDREAIDLTFRVAYRQVNRGFHVCHEPEGAISFYAVGTCRGWKGAARRAVFAKRIEVKLRVCQT